jgi:hypothetical protein
MSRCSSGGLCEFVKSAMARSSTPTSLQKAPPNERGEAAPTQIFAAHKCVVSTIVSAIVVPPFEVTG